MYLWLERVYAVPGKQISLAWAAAGVSTLMMTFGLFVIFEYAKTASSIETSSIWVSTDSKLTPFYQSEFSMIPIGYILDEPGSRMICRLDNHGEIYTCTKSELRR